MKHLQTKEADLLRKLANATATYYGCSGHGKASRNETLCEEYKQELTALNAPIPSVKELLAVGEFNGEGSC